MPEIFDLEATDFPAPPRFPGGGRPPMFGEGGRGGGPHAWAKFDARPLARERDIAVGSFGQNPSYAKISWFRCCENEKIFTTKAEK